MLSVRGLTVRYGGSIRALEGVDLTLAEPSVLAVLGANGAGKTTLLRAISGTLGLHRGSIAGGEIGFEGQRISGLPAASIVRRGLVAVPEGRQVFGRMSVEENLRAGGITVRSAAERAAARTRVHELFPVLADRARQPAGLLSGGEQQMLAIGRALMSGPRLLLLDEPSLGLAPQMVQRIGEVIRQIHGQGTAVVVVEQNAAMALEVAQSAVALEIGRVVMSGPSDELAASDDVRRLYLGGHVETGGESAAAAARADGSLQVPQLSRWSA